MRAGVGSIVFLSALALVLSAAGCEDTAPYQPDLAEAPPDLAPPPPDMTLPNRDPKDHPPALLLQNKGGPTIAAMEPYTVVWHGDDALGQKAHSFVSWLVQSDYWAGLTAEYGGGKGTPKDVVVLDDAPPATIDNAQLPALVESLVTNGKIPVVTENTVVFFVLDESTTSTFLAKQGCWDYTGYHSETQKLLGGRHVPYAVILQCDGSAASTQPGFDSVTFTMSHEALEAQSDPLTDNAPAWLTDQSALGGEVADLCLYDQTTAMVPGAPGFPDTTYVLTKSYSNVAAMAGDRPTCQPTPSDQIYYNVAVSPTTVEVVTDATGVGDADAEYQPFAYGDVGILTWTLAEQPGAGITVSPASGSAQPGATLRLHVHVTSQATGGLHSLLLGVKNAQGGRTHYYATILVD